jgi:hypothetical protein
LLDLIRSFAEVVEQRKNGQPVLDDGAFLESLLNVDQLPDVLFATVGHLMNVGLGNSY